MLVISRRVGESLILDGETEVKILAIKGNQIRIGVEGPARVVRNEILQREEEKRYGQEVKKG